MSSAPTAEVLVVGSIHVDHSLRVAQLPSPGETVIATSLLTSAGGKGANQSIAAARLGARVRLVGAVGADEDGIRALAILREQGVDTTNVAVRPEHATGSAFVAVNEAGENSIVVHSGASATLDMTAIRTELEGIADPSPAVLLVQGETSASVTAGIAAAAADRGIRFVLNLAPVVPIDTEAVAVADPLIVNETEARATYEMLFGSPSDEPTDIALARALATRARSVVVTLGERGAITASGRTVQVTAPPIPDAVIDTTGAGDALVGAVVAALAHRETLESAVRWGVHYGTLAVARRGASGSYGTADELRDSLAAARIEPRAAAPDDSAIERNPT